MRGPLSRVREPELHKMIIRDIIDAAGARRGHDERGGDRGGRRRRARMTCGGNQRR